MKALLRRIRQILRDRKTRRFFMRFVGTFAAIVVFVTTYALVLPAITMEAEAQCGIEAHQHDDSCFEEILACDIPEGLGHHHDDSCYSVSLRLICLIEEHQHGADCYDENDKLICGKTEHIHGKESGCYEEVRELVCGQEESAGHKHGDSCYEKILTCGKEAHTHSAVCYHTDSSGNTEESAVVSSTNSAMAVVDPVRDTSSSLTDKVNAGEAGILASTASSEIEKTDDPTTEKSNVTPSGASMTSATAAADAGTFADKSETVSDGSGKDTSDGTTASSASFSTSTSTTSPDAAAEASSTASTDAETSSASAVSATAGIPTTDAYVPALDPLDFNQILTGDTGIYYYHAEDKDSAPDNSGNITDWKLLDEETILDPADIIRVYLAYSIPAGSLNSTNPVARYRLPSNLHLSDSQVETINSTTNGIANQFVNMDTLEITDQTGYSQYLGVEAIEGTRKPSDDIEKYFAKHTETGGQEFISATVKVEDVYDTGAADAENAGAYADDGSNEDTASDMNDPASVKPISDVESTDSKNTVNNENNTYLGTDLVFSFTPYSIQKNQHTYDAAGKPTSAGQMIKGWLTFDLRIDQIDFETIDVETKELTDSETNKDDSDESTLSEKIITEKEAAIVFVPEIRNTQSGLDIDEISQTIHLQEIVTETGTVSGDKAEESDKEAVSDTDADSDKAAKDVKAEKSALLYPARTFQDSITVSMGTLSTDTETGQSTELPEQTELTVYVEADQETFPEGTTMKLSAVEDMESVASAVEEAVAIDEAVSNKTHGFHAVDISFWNNEGTEIEPLKPVRVSMKSESIKKAVEDTSTAPVVVHIADPAAGQSPVDSTDEDASDENESEGSREVNRASNPGNAEDLENEEPINNSDNNKAPITTIVETDKQASTDNREMDDTDTLTFETGAFSVYAIVYTVDFHWEVDGEEYEYNLAGGASMSFRELVQILHIINKEGQVDSNGAMDDEALVDEDVRGSGSSEEIDEFINDIENITFSDESLVAVVGITEENTVDGTVSAGSLKKLLGLECEYSAELSDQQIEEMNAKTFSAPDWALVSQKAFDTEEYITVKMKNGESFRIKVTDDNDPFGLNGRTYSIVTIKNGTNGHALQAGVHAVRDSRGYYLESLDVNISDPTQYLVVGGVGYVRQEATAWKFEYNAEKEAYYISNNGKYLYIDPTVTSKTGTADHSLNLVNSRDVADEGTLIKITKDDQGNYYFGNIKGTLIWDYSSGYWLSNPDAADETGRKEDNAAILLCLPENPYGSHKASLTAARDLSIGQTLVLYQKVWNSTNDAYDYYAIDGNGNLQKVWESSDSLYWKEDISIEWELREEYDTEGNPTGYLQLYNESAQTYLAPQSSGSGYAVIQNAAGLSSDNLKKIRVSLPGRDAGEYDSLIATWDYDDNTTYGIKFNYDPTEASRPCSLEVKELLQSTKFMFAVRDPLVQKQLTTVDTVDSVGKGITISMYNFNGNEGGGTWTDSNGQTHSTDRDRLKFMCNIMGDGSWESGVYKPGLVNRVLGADGFPTVASNGESVGRIFNAVNPTDAFTRTDYIPNANHLFLKSVYETTGYYYYSGFDNFAKLSGSDFVVYEQLGTPKNLGMNSDGTPTAPDNFFYYRGNFLPFNNLDTTNQVLNYYDGGDQAVVLDDDNPRKNEDLYKVNGNPDYYFGMVMEAKFQQGPNGVSDQGDPMVFEFTGDDDMWVYVDNVLLLDIGGIHDAFHGKINFQTGKIHVDGQKTGNEDTYIKEQYWQAHRFPDGTEWNDRNDSKQHLFFTNGGEEDGKLKGTYLDYSTHNMKMFYMERGAGASNLQIRFNLPVMKGDEFRVTKNMLTTASGQPIQNAYSNAKFYYKAYIKQGNTWVEYKKSDMESLTARKAVYDEEDYPEVEWKNDTIFEVRPGQTAIIPVIDKTVEYKVVEVEPEESSRMLELFNVSNSDEDPNDSKSTTGKTVLRRGQVFFDNKPIDDMVNELRITKNLHGDLYPAQTASGYVEDQNGSPYFEYRIYLEATNGQLVPYSLGEYYQIDGENGKYVYYDKGTRKYAEPVIISGETWYSYTYTDSSKNETTAEPKITEHTSQNGSLGDVRPGDTIIIKGLMEGTDFVVDERLDRTHMRQYTIDEDTHEVIWQEDWDNYSKRQN